jgi:hypothetical protein
MNSPAPTTMSGLLSKPHGLSWPRETPAAPAANELETLARRLGVAWPQPLTPDGKIAGYAALELLRALSMSEHRAAAESFVSKLRERKVI